ncbi:MAG: carbohydrate kinase family protein [Anaerolineaceae bacterium]
MNFDVIVLGDYCLDLIFTGLESMPQLGREIESNAFAMVPGGACNVSLALHRLGVNTAWAAEFGTDDFSQFVLKQLREDKFPEDLFVFYNKQLRKVTVSLSYPEDRAFIAYYDPGNLVKAALTGLTNHSAKVVLIPSLFFGAPLQAGSLLAKSKKMEIFMDGNNSTELTIKDPSIKNALKLVRWFSPNSKEARSLTQIDNLEDAARALGDYCQTVIIKDGGNGAYCCDNDKVYYEPAHKVKVVDTTGAGDCFDAGFLRAWLNNKQIQECLRWGNIAGGLSTKISGANSYRLSVAEIEEIITREAK